MGKPLSTLTKSRACFRPAHGRHDDEAEALVLPTADVHVIGLHHGAHQAAATAPAAADATGAATPRAHGVERILASLRGALLFNQGGRLVAAVMRRRW